MHETFKRRLMAAIYFLAVGLMAASLAVTELRPKALASTCPNEGQPCNIDNNGYYACTGGINGGRPIPGCACDIANFCTGDVR